MIFAFLVSCGDPSSNYIIPLYSYLVGQYQSEWEKLYNLIIPLYSYPVGQYQSEWEKLYNLNTSNIVYTFGEKLPP